MPQAFVLAVAIHIVGFKVDSTSVRQWLLVLYLKSVPPLSEGYDDSAPIQIVEL